MKPLDYTEFLEIGDQLKKKSSYKTPIASDFEITGLGTFAQGQPYTVSITPKTEKSTGAITVYFDDSTTPPVAVGVYVVTFDVAGVIGFNAAKNLYAGMLTITSSSYATPVINDFSITGLGTYVEGTSYSISITPKTGKSNGKIDIYYNGSPVKPVTAGVYLVAFEVAATAAFNGAGLYAGMLTITSPAAETPVTSDFHITGLGTYEEGQRYTVSITPKTDVFTGAITTYYCGSTTKPTAAGVYLVTFEVTASEGFNAAGLSAGMLTITSPALKTPVLSDFYIIGCGRYTYDGKPHEAVITKDGSSDGITVFYNGSQNKPIGVDVYLVTFEVDACAGYNAAGLNAGMITITSSSLETPAAGEFTIVGLGTYTYDGNPREVTVTRKTGGSDGITVFYNGSEDIPVDVGVYLVTFEVDAVSGYNAVGLNAGMLTITSPTLVTPKPTDFSIKGLGAYGYGEPFTVSITPEANGPTGKITVFYNGTQDLPVDVNVYLVTFEVDADSKFNAMGLTAGMLTITTAAPKADHFVVADLVRTFNESQQVVTVTAKNGKSTGAITVKYNGQLLPPTTANQYPITIDIEADLPNFYAATLNVGTLIINPATPAADNYNIVGAGVSTYGNPRSAVTVIRKSGSNGAVSNIKYNGNTALPVDAGSYTITFDVAADLPNWNGATVTAGTTLIINKANPSYSDFNYSTEAGFFSNTNTYVVLAGSSIIPSITSKAGKSNGAISNIKYDGSTTPPVTTDRTSPCIVTWDVAEDSNWNAVTIGNAVFNIASLNVWVDNIPNDLTTTYTLKSPECGTPAQLRAAIDLTKANPNVSYKLEITLNFGSGSMVIGNNFSGCSNITGVIVRDTTTMAASTQISPEAFSNCTNLTSVTFSRPYFSQNLGLVIFMNAFSNCTNLTTVIFEGYVIRGSAPVFLGDLDSFAASNYFNTGTYKTTAPVGASSIWVKQ
jgi:antitoxin component YwqK of YwqJK toxin-antitoxin module